MEIWSGWLRFKNSVLYPTKCRLLKFTMRFRPKAKENRRGLLSVYQDMESCGEYEDIQVMWKMIHSSRPLIAHQTRRRSKRPCYWRFRLCLMPS